VTSSEILSGICGDRRYGSGRSGALERGRFMKPCSAKREKWIEAGMKQERRQEQARRLVFFGPRRSGLPQIVGIATRQPV
jgi:hypothetical protein